MKTSNQTLRKQARGAVTSLKSILTTNLATQREVGKEHEREHAQQEKERKFYGRKYWALIQHAGQGACKLILLHKSPEIREVLDILKKIHPRNPEFVLHQADVDLGGEFLGWTHGLFEISMKNEHVVFWGSGQIRGEGHDFSYCLDDPGSGEEETSVEAELDRASKILNANPKEIVLAVEAIDLFAEVDDTHTYENGAYFFSWLAFLAACADDDKLGKLMERAFKKLEKEQTKPN